MKARITGGPGLLGKELRPSLEGAAVLPRDLAEKNRELGVGRAVRWDPAAEPAPLLPRAAERTGDALKHTELEGALAALMAAPQRKVG